MQIIKSIKHKFEYLVFILCFSTNIFAQNPCGEFTQSSEQAFYFFDDVIILHEIDTPTSLENDDWICAFNGNVAVGGVQWTEECEASQCEIAVMGDDGFEYSQGYLEEGIFPTFKIWDNDGGDGAVGEFVDAFVTCAERWVPNSILEAGNLRAGVLGCTDYEDNFYSPDATVDNGSCRPDVFEYKQSVLQGFYFFTEAFDLEGTLLNPTDWIAAFNGDICVGAQRWDTSQCGGGVCDVPVMGDDNSDFTDGYMQSGQIPTFKIYDSCLGEFYSAIASEDDPWYNNELFMIDTIQAVSEIQQIVPLHFEQNLVSFYALPNANGTIIEEVLDSDCFTAAVSESAAAMMNTEWNDDSDIWATDSLGYWIGTLTELDNLHGYWIRSTCFSENISILGPPVAPPTYQLHSGGNLISFPSTGQVGIGNAIDDDIEQFFHSIVGESSATMRAPNGDWVGSLEGFSGGNGYWINSLNPVEFDFSYNLSNLVLSRSFNNSLYDLDLDEVVYNQSHQQAFYFMDLDNLDNSNIMYGDWILAYNNDVLVGSRQWYGGIIDVPVMGNDGNDFTQGYCNPGDIPTFKVMLFDGNLIDIISDYPEWNSNGTFMIENIYQNESNLLPGSLELTSVYPNPFNPVTTINFINPYSQNISINIYNMLGEYISTIYDKELKAGTHSFTWNASNYSSGVYIVKIVSYNETAIQKIVLIK